MHKYNDKDIKPFQFSALESDHVIEQAKFQPFEFQTLNGEELQSTTVPEEVIRKEREFAQKNNFKVDEIVKDFRGISRQEKNDIEIQIQEEVKRRLETAYQEAYAEGLERGRQEGKDAALTEHQDILAQKVDAFSEVITQVQAESNLLLDRNRNEIFDFVKRFTKWIVLKEIDEKVYLEALLEKLIHELNTKKNLIIKVGKENFSQMPEVIQIVESRLGQLTNVRVEIVPELCHPGIVLESENGLIDGSLEGVFQNIDKIFSQVYPDRILPDRES